jgi:hypothetical protein
LWAQKLLSQDVLEETTKKAIKSIDFINVNNKKIKKQLKLKL